MHQKLNGIWDYIFHRKNSLKKQKVVEFYHSGNFGDALITNLMSKNGSNVPGNRSPVYSNSSLGGFLVR